MQKKGTKDSKRQKIRERAVKCHFLARHSHGSRELTAGVNAYTRSTKGESGTDRRGTHGVLPFTT